MVNPYEILGLTRQTDDAAVRSRYLQLVREYPPEFHPEKAAAIRSAYETLQSLDRRARYHLFEEAGRENLESIIEDAQCQGPMRRITITELLRITGRAAS